MNKLDLINKNWSYKKDSSDKWQVKKISDDINGDCEDYSLTVLYHFVCGGSLLKFLWHIVSGKAVFWYAKALSLKGRDMVRSGHVIMQLTGNDVYIDNWERAFVMRHVMEDKHKHEFVKKYSRFSVLYRLFSAHIGQIPAMIIAWVLVVCVLMLLQDLALFLTGLIS